MGLSGVGAEMHTRHRLAAVFVIFFVLSAFATLLVTDANVQLHPRTFATEQVTHVPAQIAHVRLLADDSNGGGGTGGSSGATSTPLRLKAMDWAANQQGCWYEWGGTGPCAAGYDCSGLVYEAYLHQGINIGRDTSQMLRNKHLRRVSWNQVARGMLAFFGSRHVELVWQKRWHRTVGALHSGTRVGNHKWGGSWVPTAFYKIVRK